MKTNLLALFLISISLQSFCQITGRVVDENNAPLPSVNIFLENTFNGTTSNEEGYYELPIKASGDQSIVFQILGYKTFKKEIDIKRIPKVLNVILKEEQIELKEVIINSRENPADRVIRNAIAARKNNYEKIQSFHADFYSRGLVRIKDAPQKFLGQKMDEFLVGLDSTRSGIIYLSETISKIDYIHPDKLKEKIIASKVSGSNNGFSFNTANDVNFNFYENSVLLGNPIISPIADYAFNYYSYKLEGVFYDDKGNLINKIKVIPRRKNDRIFSGDIYIVENQWNIYAVELSLTGTQAQLPPAELITIKQNFSYSDHDDKWVLISQSLNFSYSLFGFMGQGNFTAVYSNYDFNTNLFKKSFGKEIVAFGNEANKKDSSYWTKRRPIPLTEEEIKDYLLKDSIQIVRESKPYLDSIDSKNNKFKVQNILVGYQHRNSFEDWSIGFSSPLSDLQFNTVQGYNAKLNLTYRKNQDKYRRYYSLQGTLHYGLSDDRLRGTTAFTYKFNNIKKPTLTLSGGIETKQFNDAQPISPLINSISTLFFEKNYMKIYDRSFAQIQFKKEIVNGLDFVSNLAYVRRKALLNTNDQTFFPRNEDGYSSNDPQYPDKNESPSFHKHHILKFNLNARINFSQEYLSYPDTKVNIPSNKYPTLHLGFEKGMGTSGKKRNFDEFKLRLTQNLEVGHKGSFNYNLKSGTFIKSSGMEFMDYYHPNGNQTHIGSSRNYLDTFNNLPYYKLSTNSSYLEMHAEHDFKGYILNRVPLLNKLNYNVILGAHLFTTAHHKPYQEFSVGIDNVGFKKFRYLRIDYVRSYQDGYVNDAFILGLKFLNFIQ